MDFTSIVSMLQDLSFKLAIVAWIVTGLTWFIGWIIRGSPVPLRRVKRVGQSLIEDAVIAAFWLALSTTIFALIQLVANNLNVNAPTLPLTVPIPTSTSGG